MEKQKKIALINDLTGFGRCSIAVELPLISALGVQACPLPTAILSVHTDFPHYFLDDYTEKLPAYVRSWQENKLAFDGIATGFMSSVRQITLVQAFINAFKTQDTLVIVDPVMGDDGRLYASYTPALCAAMRKLVEKADVITPNLTEACQLTGQDYPAAADLTPAYLVDLAAALTALGPRQVVITGLTEGKRIGNYLYEKGQKPALISVEKTAANRPGTGDAFAAIVSAALVRGESLTSAVTKASTFIQKALVYTEKLGQPKNWGLAFEGVLKELY